LAVEVAEILVVDQQHTVPYLPSTLIESVAQMGPYQMMFFLLLLHFEVATDDAVRVREEED
jgi:hypothetical protein